MKLIFATSVDSQACKQHLGQLYKKFASNPETKTLCINASASTPEEYNELLKQIDEAIQQGVDYTLVTGDLFSPVIEHLAYQERGTTEGMFHLYSFFSNVATLLIGEEDEDGDEDVDSGYEDEDEDEGESEEDGSEDGSEEDSEEGDDGEDSEDEGDVVDLWEDGEEETPKQRDPTIYVLNFTPSHNIDEESDSFIEEDTHRRLTSLALTGLVTDTVESLPISCFSLELNNEVDVIIDLIEA